MARKSNSQRRRELNLRGRSITAQAETEEDGNNGELNPTANVPGPMDGVHLKTKDINQIIGCPELIVETDEDSEDENEKVVPDTKTEHGSGKQRM
ncbi:hypothetical protein vseg_010750 [Gypsophila vaccaria]